MKRVVYERKGYGYIVCKEVTVNEETNTEQVDYVVYGANMSFIKCFSNEDAAIDFVDAKVKKELEQDNSPSMGMF